MRLIKKVSCLADSLTFLKNGPIPDSFCLFLSFTLYNFNRNWKKHRWCTWDLNPGPQDGRHRQNHGAVAATRLKMFVFQMKNKNQSTLISTSLSVFIFCTVGSAWMARFEPSFSDIGSSGNYTRTTANISCLY